MDRSARCDSAPSHARIGTAGRAQWTLTSELAAADVPTWQWWQVRPLSWEDAEANPKLFRFSRQFWQTLVTEQEARATRKTSPDYREPERQVVYNETWNMVANPVRARRQIDVARPPTSAASRCGITTSGTTWGATSRACTPRAATRKTAAMRHTATGTAARATWRPATATPRARSRPRCR